MISTIVTFVVGAIMLLVVGIFIFAGVMAVIESLEDGMNDLCRCNKCGLVYRKYQRQISSNENKCPHCKENSSFEYIPEDTEEYWYKYPFAPKISTIKALKMKGLIKENIKNEYMDKQIEMYLKVQEEQLKKMEQKKDEMIKSGAFDE